MHTTRSNWKRNCLIAIALFPFGISNCYQAACTAQAPSTPMATGMELSIKPIAPLTPEQTTWRDERLKLWLAADNLAKTNFDRAIANMSQVLQRDQQVFGIEHLESARTMADLYWQNDFMSNRLPPLIDQELQILLKAYGIEDWRVRKALCARERRFRLIKGGTALNDRANAADKHVDDAKRLRTEEKYDDALTALKKAIDIRTAVFGEDSTDVAQTLWILADVHSKSYRYEEAEKVAEKASQIVRSWNGSKSPEYSDALIGKAIAAEYQGKNALFENLALQALAVAESAAECPPSYLAAAHFCLGRSFKVNGSTTRAESQIQKAIALYTAEGDTTSLNVLRYQSWLGNCAIELSRFEEASKIFDALEKTLRAEVPERDWRAHRNQSITC